MVGGNPASVESSVCSAIGNALAFHDRDDAVDARYGNFFSGAAWPVDFEFIDFGGGPKTEVQAGVGR
jgi:hypothetical protein